MSQRRGAGGYVWKVLRAVAPLLALSVSCSRMTLPASPDTQSASSLNSAAAAAGTNPPGANDTPVGSPGEITGTATYTPISAPTATSMAPGSPPPGNSTTGKLPAEKLQITFNGSKGDEVRGYLWLPERTPDQKLPGLLIMYGISGNKNDDGVRKSAEALQREGFMSLTFDWPGTGDRTPRISNAARVTDRSVKDWTVDDYQAALSYLETRAELDKQKIGYIGASMGAMTGIALSAKPETRLKAMVFIVPMKNPLWGSDAPEKKIKSIGARPHLCIYLQENADGSADVCGNAAGEKKAIPGGHEPDEATKGVIVEAAKSFMVKALK